MQDGKSKVIAYVSRGMRGGEKSKDNYSSKKLELLALKWVVTEELRDYLHDAHFTVYTDNNPLTHVLTQKKLPALEQRWLMHWRASTLTSSTDRERVTPMLMDCPENPTLLKMLMGFQVAWHQH